VRWEVDSAKEAKEEYLITILNGRLFIVRQGNFILLTSPIILKNGVIITTDGRVCMPDGKRRILLEGEYI